ncbi:MAG: rhodanese-like domain-containing protein [Euryarchaeota archaeon]|nr:rhodanese-like domain-containing protein [Euryarchaeota archaeon]
MDQKTHFYRGVVLLSLILILMGASGCVDDVLPDNDTTIPQYIPEVHDVPVEQAKAMIDDGDVFILDLRNAGKYRAGHIEGATLIPYSDLESRLDEVPKDKHLLVYCRTGFHSATAADLLVEKGYMDVYNMLGGFNSWESKGYPYVE